MNVRQSDRRFRFRTERGQSLVEFALALPLLMLVILGMIDFGIAFNYNQDETSLANQAIRFAVVDTCGPCGPQSIEDYVKSNADSGDLKNGGSGIGIQTPGVTITFCSPDPGYVPGTPIPIGQPLKAKVTADYAFLPYLISTVGLPNVASISASVVQRVETQYNGVGFDPGNPLSDAYTVTGPC